MQYSDQIINNCRQWLGTPTQYGHISHTELYDVYYTDLETKTIENYFKIITNENGQITEIVTTSNARPYRYCPVTNPHSQTHRSPDGKHQKFLADMPHVMLQIHRIIKLDAGIMRFSQQADQMWKKADAVFTLVDAPGVQAIDAPVQFAGQRSFRKLTLMAPHANARDAAAPPLSNITQLYHISREDRTADSKSPLRQYMLFRFNIHNGPFSFDIHESEASICLSGISWDPKIERCYNHAT